MKKIIPISALLLLYLLVQQSSMAKKGKLFYRSNSKTHDTIFISREVIKDNYCAVYIEQNRQSRTYHNLLDFTIDSDETVLYKQNYDAVKKRHPAALKTFNLLGLPKEWLPLYQYKNKFYLYYPSEAGNMGRRFITGSTLVYWYMDGPYPYPIQTIRKINAHTWYVKARDYIVTRGTKQLIIHIIDPTNNIAVWEDTSIKGEGRYELYVPKENAGNFDMIVNFCKENKTAEFLFDKPNYKALLNKN